MDGWITTQEAARRLGVTEQAVRRALAENRLKGEKIGGRWLIEEKGVSAKVGKIA